MANETEEKTKQTVPAMERTAKGVAAHAAAVQDRQWDKERKVFKDPVIATLALFTYAKLTAALLDEAEARSAQKISALEKRVAEFETRLAAMEKWKTEAEAQTSDMVKHAEEMLAAGPENFFDKLRSALPSQPETKTLPVVEMRAAEIPAELDSTVTPLKQPKQSKKQAADEKNGGAA